MNSALEHEKKLQILLSYKNNVISVTYHATNTINIKMKRNLVHLLRKLKGYREALVPLLSVSYCIYPQNTVEGKPLPVGASV